MIAETRLHELAEKWHRARIGLLGDLFLDRYMEIDARLDEPSLETGLPAWQVVRIRNMPGALGTVMANLAALGAERLVPVTVIGDDGLGFDLSRSLADWPIDDAGVIRSPQRLTPSYIKPLRCTEAGETREQNRLDVRTRAPLSDQLLRQVLSALEHAWSHVDAWVVLDQIAQPDEGVVHRVVRDRLHELAASDPSRPVLIDSRCQLAAFEAGSLKGNQHEFKTLLEDGPARSASEASTIREAVRRAADRTGRPAFCTCGASGMWVGTPHAEPRLVAGFPVEGPIDIVGAGDAATAALALSLVAGADPVEAACVANLAASVTVAKVGTTGTASVQELLARLRAAREADQAESPSK